MSRLNRLYIGGTIFVAFFSGPAFGGGASEHVSAAVTHSGNAVAHTSVAAVKLVSGAVAAPLMVSGEVGKASGRMGEALWEEANTPLPVTDEVITAGPPPARAMGREKRE